MFLTLQKPRKFWDRSFLSLISGRSLYQMIIFSRGREDQKRFFSAWKVLKVCSKRHIKNHLFFRTTYSIMNCAQTSWWIPAFVAILVIFPTSRCHTHRNFAWPSDQIQRNSPKTYTESGQDEGKKMPFYAVGALRIFSRGLGGGGDGSGWIY